MPEIKLAGKTYDLEGTTFTERSKWRNKYARPIIEKLGGSLKDLGLVDLIPKAKTEAGAEGEAQNGEKPDVLYAVLRQSLNNSSVVIALVSDMIDTAFEAVCSYSKAIADDRDHINKHCTETEVVMALLLMLRVVYPLEVMFGLMGSIG